MAYLATTATDRFALFTAIASFATASGWTIDWNVATDNGQLGLHKGTTFVAIGARSVTPSISRQMLFTGGTVNDVPLQATLATALNGTQKVWGGHTGAPAAVANSQLYVWFNDFEGPFTNVFLFSNATGDYIHVIAQNGAKYSMFSFGLLDNAGLTTNRSSYLTGTWFEFWENSASPTNVAFSPNRPSKVGSWATSAASNSLNIGHHFMFMGRGSDSSGLLDQNVHIRPGVSVVNAGIFTTNPLIWSGAKPLMNMFDSRLATTAWTRFLPGVMLNALPTTIGLPLMDLPVISPQPYATSMFFGAYPDVRFVWMEDLAPGQELDVNGNIWKVFPFKQKGAENAVAIDPAINTWGYGLAFRKIP